MKTKFKIGDEVIVTYHPYNIKNQEAKIVAIDSDGDYLVKCTVDVGTYDWCFFNNYKSDKDDLVIVGDENLKLRK